MTGPYESAARDYVAAGWLSPLPLPVGLKGPPPTGYTGFDGAIPSAADVQTWIDTKGDSNVGIRLPANVVGIDVDDYDGKGGGDTLAQLEADLGELPPTAVSTARPAPSGIRWYRVPERPSWRNPGKGIEIVHRGWRFAVAPPSVHPNGDTYEWRGSHSGNPLPADYAPPHVDTLPMLPDAWVEFLALAQGGADKARLDDEGTKAWLADLPDGEPCPIVGDTVLDFDIALGDPPKDRHDLMLDHVGRLMRLGEAQHVGVGAALHLGHDVYIAEVADNRAQGERAASSEWWRSVVGALAIIEADPAVSVCRCNVYTLDGFDDVNILGETPQEPPTGDGAAPLVTPPDDLTDVERAVYERLPRVDWAAAFAADPDDVDWIVEGLIERGRHAALYAGHKVGKSLLTLEIAAAVAAGDTDVVGCTIPEPRTVLYIDWENSRDDYVGRLMRLGRTPDQLDRLVYLSMPIIPPMDTAEGGAQLVAAAEVYGADWIVLDTFSRAVEGAENDSDTYRDYYRHAGMQLKANGVALWRLDHSGKDVSRGQRGSSAKGDDVDLVYSLTRKGDTFTLTREVTRTMHGTDELRFTRAEGETSATRLTGPVSIVGGIDDAVAECMVRISDLAHGLPHQRIPSMTALRDGTSGKKAHIDAARDHLVTLRYLLVETTDTGGLAYTLDHPFTRSGDEGVAVGIDPVDLLEEVEADADEVAS